EWVETATHATLRCMELTRQLLVFSRHQAKRKEAVNINNLISTMQTMIARSVIPEVKVQYRLEQNLWASLIDPGEFQDAVLNLVLNSRDAMPSGGSLIIETLNKNIDLAANTHIPDINPGEYILFSVTDTGTGLSAEVKERIFEPFFTTKPVGKGTGLGLAMVYGFAKRYDGFVNVESEENNGASIHIYLPRYIQTDASAKKDIIEEILPTGTETILIVDDEPDLLSLADRYLTSLGYNTIMTSDATSALEILSKNSEIALLFTDIVMPDVMNGYDLAEKAKACNPGIKILLTSGYAQDSEDSARLSSLIVNLLPKPYRKADLAHQIRTILDKPVSD
ncbi:MAG: response regulator, partial [Gammaproteobacteria bacterium]|nr:response regulator [Gammaproteobacteria bacterium]